jgi:hypothetical protein
VQLGCSFSIINQLSRLRPSAVSKGSPIPCSSSCQLCRIAVPSLDAEVGGYICMYVCTYMASQRASCRHNLFGWNRAGIDDEVFSLSEADLIEDAVLLAQLPAEFDCTPGIRSSSSPKFREYSPLPRSGNPGWATRWSKKAAIRG